MRDDVTLVHRLDEHAHDYDESSIFDTASLLMEAAERISELEEQNLRLKGRLRRLTDRIVIHRGERTNWIGGVHDCDRRLWEVIADVPQSEIKGDM